MQKNNWYVLTGGPSSGKTSLLEIFKNKGFQIVPEAARIYIDQEIAKGLSIVEIRKDEIGFQHKILEMKLEMEKNLDPQTKFFFDRGIPDSLAYLQLHGYEITAETLQAMKNCSYEKIFLLEPLPFESDYARTESEEQRNKLQELLESTYKNLGFEVVQVPVLPLEDRANFICDIINK